MPRSGSSSMPDSSLWLLFSALPFFAWIVILLLFCSCLVLITMMSSGLRLLGKVSYLRAWLGGLEGETPPELATLPIPIGLPALTLW